MDIASITLSLGGDDGNTVPKFGVTAAEIAVLRTIHGEASVKDVEPSGEISRSNRAERQRLVDVYGQARFGNDKPVVETLFPGVAARVFERIDELDLDESFFKPIARASAESGRGRVVAYRAAELNAPYAPEAEDEDEDDEAEDMNDEHAELGGGADNAPDVTGEGGEEQAAAEQAAAEQAAAAAAAQQPKPAAPPAKPRSGGSKPKTDAAPKKPSLLD